MKSPKIIFSDSNTLDQEINDFLKKEITDIYIYYPSLLKGINIKADKILPRYWQTDFRRLLLRNNLVNFHLVGFPLCIFPKQEVTVFVNFLDPYQGVYLDKCNRCKEKHNCFGVPHNYLKRFGDDEFNPFSEKDYLLAVDWRKNKIALKKIWDVERERQKRIWKNYFKDIKGRILDAGAGSGAFLSFSPRRIVGIEKEAAKVDNIMKKVTKIDLRLGDITDIKFNDNYFGGVYCRFVLEHLFLEEAKLAIKEFRRVLRPRGKLFVMTSGKDERESWYVRHETYFTRGILNDLAKKIGFRKYKTFNSELLEKYQKFDFRCNIQNKYNHLKEKAVCLIAEK